MTYMLSNGLWIIPTFFIVLPLVPTSRPAFWSDIGPLETERNSNSQLSRLV